MIKMRRPVMLGVALTNRPHVRLRKHPITIVEEDGEKLARIPFMVKNTYHHPKGDFDMNEKTFDAFLNNQQKRAADFDLAVDAKHLPDLGSWVWLEKNLGGRVVQETVGEDTLLVGYGKPTSDEALARIERGQFRSAALEFHPNYRSNVKQTYLASDFISDGKIIKIGGNMEFELQEDGSAIVNAEDVETLQKLQEDTTALEVTNVELESTLTDLNKEVEDQKVVIDTLENTKVELEAEVVELKGATEDEPTDREIALQAENITLRNKAVEREIDLAVSQANAYVDADGRGHSAIFIDTVKSLMSLSSMDDGAIKLENDDHPAYLRLGLAKLLKVTPGQIQKETTVVNDDTRELENDKVDMKDLGKETAKAFQGEW